MVALGAHVRFIATVVDEVPAQPQPKPPRLEEETVGRPVRMPPAATPRSGPPVHPLAALLLVAVDNLWTLPEFTIVSVALTIPLSFITVFLPTFVIQRWLKRDRWGKSFLLAGLLGGLAAVPTSIFGTPVGLALLAWTGFDRLLGRSTPARQQDP